VEVWGSVLAGRKLDELRLRDGLRVGAPKNVHLWNHFNEIWLERAYTPSGFEIEPGSTVVDIGANIGLFSLLAARKALRVFSFEPYGPCFDWLSRNINTNNLGGTVHPFKQAVGDVDGTRTFYVHPEFTSNNFYQSTIGEPVTVTCTTLGAILKDHCDNKCDFLKMDCEGAEFEILLGADDDLLRRIGKISLEVHEGVGGHTRADLERRLSGVGFEVQSRQDRFGCVTLRGRNLNSKITGAKV
jgi:FkbM family methyltransferase